MTSCRPITRGFLAIWSPVLRFVTRSVIDRKRRVPEPGRPVWAGESAHRHPFPGRCERSAARPTAVQERCADANTKATAHAVPGARRTTLQLRRGIARASTTAPRSIRAPEFRSIR